MKKNREQKNFQNQKNFQHIACSTLVSPTLLSSAMTVAKSARRLAIGQLSQKSKQPSPAANQITRIASIPPTHDKYI